MNIYFGLICLAAIVVTLAVDAAALVIWFNYRDVLGKKKARLVLAAALVTVMAGLAALAMYLVTLTVPA